MLNYLNQLRFKKMQIEVISSTTASLIFHLARLSEYSFWQALSG